MKNQFAILFFAILISTGAFAQKEELKTLKKIYDKDTPTDKDLAEYKLAVSNAETTLAGASESDRVYINYFKSELPMFELQMTLSKPENQANAQVHMMKAFNLKNLAALAEAYNNVVDFEKRSGKAVYTKDIQETVTQISPMILNFAIALEKQKNYKDASQVLYDLYLMDKNKPDNLFFAADYARVSQDYDSALKYYTELKNIKYSGEGTSYIAKSLASDKDESFATKAERDKMITLKTHINPREEKLQSKRGEIYKNIALILVEKGRVEEAKAAFTDAKKENPDDTTILFSEADLYLSLKDTETYRKLISQILEKNPNDVDMVYNLGVISMQGEKYTEAETFFKRAIEINPKYTNAYVNMAAIKLKADKVLVDEINKLGTSEKDNKRYAVLKKERDQVFRNALPFLEKAYELDPKNEGVADNLTSVYNYLEMTDKYKAMKALKK